MFRRSPDRARQAARFRALRSLYASYGVESTAEGKARTLLRAWLSLAQRNQFDTHGWFEVVGGTTGKLYRVTYGTCANVFEVANDGILVTGLCFVPAGRLAEGDVMLAQKIALETAESRALSVAQAFPPRLPRASADARATFLNAACTRDTIG
jgi:hypothetical protein